MNLSLDLPAIVTIALVLALYVVVALCAMWAWQTRSWFLAVPLTLIFAVSTIAVVWVFERWGTP